MVFLALNKIAYIFENRAFNSHRMDSKENAYLLKDQYLSAFSSKSQAKAAPFKIPQNHCPRISDHTVEPSRYFTPIPGPQSGAGDVTWQVVKPTTRHVNVVPPLQHSGRRILHPVPGFLRRHLESSSGSDIDQSRLPPKKRRYSHAGEGEGPVAKVSKTVTVDNSQTPGFSHSENSLFSAYRCPSKQTAVLTKGGIIVQSTAQAADAQHDASAVYDNHLPGSTVLQSQNVQPRQVGRSHDTNTAHVQNAYGNDTEASDDDNEIADIMGNVQPRHSLNRSRETTVAYAQSAYDEDSDEDSEVAEIMENDESKKYPILGYRLVRFTHDIDDEDEDDYNEYDGDVKGGYSNEGCSNDDGYQGDDDCDHDDDDHYHNDDHDDDDDDDRDSEDDDIQRRILIVKKGGCQSPREPWLADVRDINNSEAGSDVMDEAMLSCFRPTTPEVIRLSDHSILSTPSVTDSKLSLSQFSPVIIRSDSTIGSISDFTTSPSSNRRPGNFTAELSLDDEGPEGPTVRTDDEDRQDDMSADAVLFDKCINDLTEVDEGRLRNDRVTTSKPLLAVNPSTSLTEFRASVLVGERLSVRRYEEWFTKSKDEQFAEILEDFLEENEGQLFDHENKIREMLADTRDRIAEQRKAIRNARDTNTRLSLSGDSASDESIEVEGDDAGESSPEINLVDEPASSENRLCGCLASFFGHSGCADYMIYRRHTLQTDSDQAFYSMIFKQDSPVNDGSYSDDIDFQNDIYSRASSNDDGIDSQTSSNTASSQFMDDSEIIIVD